MKKKTLYLTIVMALIMAMGASAAPIGQTAARDAALQHLVSASASTQLKGGLPTGDLLLLYAEPSDVMTDQAAYYIFNSDDAFVVVAGDDRAGILARGDAPLDMNRIPCGLHGLLDMYKGDVDFLLANPMLNVAAQNPGVGTSVAPLLTTEWDQDEPYYNSCPVYQGENCLTGCACTSLAQVMYYWRYANLTSPIEGYTTESLGLRLEELQPTEFDWDNMIENCYFTSYNDVQAQAVALLMRYVGQAEHMDYAPDGSGTNEQEIADAALKFGYDEGLRRLSKSNFTADQWDALLKTELAAGRPVIYRGQDVNNRGGHSFVIDGYDADGLFHVNFGWSGFGNAYCAMNDFSAYGYTFAFLQGMIIGIQPPEYVEPSIMVAPSSLMLNSHVGNRVSKTFTVKGYARTYSGVPVQGAKVAYTVERRFASWWWRSGSDDDESAQVVQA